jgi:sortase A
MRRTIGTLFSIAGAALLLAVGFTYAKGAIARDRARAEWEAVEGRGVRLAANGRIAGVDALARVARGAPIGRLIIPSIGVDEVVVEGVSDEQLNAGPGHLPESAFPGEAGNAVISAHRDRHFHGLDRIAVGDTIVTETFSGRTAWVVVGRRIVERGEPALFATSDPTLTLTTCWPVRYVGPAPDRLLVTAKMIGRSVR